MKTLINNLLFQKKKELKIKKVFEKIKKVFHSKKFRFIKNWNQKKISNLEKIKTIEIFSFLKKKPFFENFQKRILKEKVFCFFKKKIISEKFFSKPKIKNRKNFSQYGIPIISKTRLVDINEEIKILWQKRKININKAGKKSQKKNLFFNKKWIIFRKIISSLIKKNKILIEEHNKTKNKKKLLYESLFEIRSMELDFREMFKIL
ncbi:hypothetical protein HAN_2g328 (nucleomorph) [Hemiselmis andersenii]|uniref:Uncharacterized protein n=2 Tax=Hemiselmis andersenii TaxID=464988 RepID=A9BKZ1_HEMAN|nr:hypothetical protein HAN_2g328 [Hemiselmis andersenii]ABW98146.1 hypothetical protein HAN_2g328 [Hemiselmis andersenii]